MCAAATRFNMLKELLQCFSYFIHLSIAGGYVKMRSYVKMRITILAVYSETHSLSLLRSLACVHSISSLISRLPVGR